MPSASTIPQFAQGLDIHWFSGTGNTLLAAEALAGEFRSAGVDVRLLPMERTDPSSIDPARVLGLAIPVYAFAPPKVADEWVAGLPRVNGTPAFLLDTLGGFSGGMVGALRRRLERKGFSPVGARDIRMPDTFFVPDAGAAARSKREVALDATRAYANDLLAGRMTWPRVPVVSDISCALGKWGLAGRRLLPYALRLSVPRANAARCVGCGVCAALCPAKAIDMIEPTGTAPAKEVKTEDEPRDNGRRPKVDDRHCSVCVRCVAVCPYDAMRLRLAARPPYRPLPAAELGERFRAALKK